LENGEIGYSGYENSREWTDFDIELGVIGAVGGVIVLISIIFFTCKKYKRKTKYGADYNPKQSMVSTL